MPLRRPAAGTCGLAKLRQDALLAPGVGHAAVALDEGDEARAALLASARIESSTPGPRVSAIGPAGASGRTLIPAPSSGVRCGHNLAPVDGRRPRTSTSSP